MKRLVYISSLIFLFKISSPVFSAGPIVINEELKSLPINNSVDLFIDRNNSYDINKIINSDKKREIEWHRANDESLSRGFSNEICWVKFTLLNDSQNDIQLFMQQKYPSIDYIDLYISPDNGELKEIKTGDRYLFKERPVEHRTFVFPLMLRKKETKTYYMRFQTTGILNIYLNLWDPSYFNEYRFKEYIIIWSFCMVLIALVLYNTFIFFFTRDRAYVFYILFNITTLLFIMSLNGTAYQYLWPDNVWWANFSIPVLFAVSMFFAIQFAKNFINVWDIFKKTVIILRCSIYSVVFITFLLVLCNRYNFALKFLIVTLTMMIFYGVSVIIFIAVKAPGKIVKRQAWFYLISWLPFLIAELLNNLKTMQVIPENIFINYGLYFGFAAQAMLLSLGLADKINVMKKELQEFSDNLELKVEERTHELQQANEKLETLDRMKTNFFANISHELRTPLTLILSPVEAVLQEDAHIAAGKEFFYNIQRNTLKLLRLVNNLLDYSKIEAGRMDLYVREVDVVEIMGTYTEGIMSAAESKGITVNFISESRPVKLFLDLDKTDRVIMNLFSNALKFTPRGGSITVRVIEDNNNCSIMVEDTGEGIPSAKIDSVFDRFSQAGVKCMGEGTGIGLSLVSELAGLMGASISVESKYRADYPHDHGTRFVLTFPKGAEHLLGRETVHFIDNEEIRESFEDGLSLNGIRQMLDIKGRPDTEEPVSGMQPREGGAPVNDGEKDKEYTILIVDDNKDMRDLLSLLLGKRYNIETAPDGIEGLKMTRAIKPDLIIADVMMPALDGKEMTRILKEDSDFKSIPVIMLTARTDIATKIEGLEYGADDYLTKPFNSRELFVRVKMLIEKTENERALEDRNRIIEEELSTARLLQQRLLPDGLPRLPGFQSSIRYIPMDKVGGDFYDFKVNDNRIELLIADVSGHGLPGAFLSMIAKMAFESIEERSAVKDVLARINDVILKSTVKNNFVTSFYCAIDRSTHIMKYCNAGHFPPFVYRKSNDRFYELTAKGNPLGWFTNLMLEEKEFQLMTGDRAVLYTDGITECMNPERVMFGMGRFRDFIRDNIELSPDELCERLLITLKSHAESDSFADDLCLIVFDVLSGSDT